MSNSDRIVLFHAPNTRSTGTLILLEELGVPYELQVLNMQRASSGRPPLWRSIRWERCPAILHDDVLVTEQVAIYLYLADLFPQAGLAPGLDDKRRGPYLRWMAFYAACFEPAVVDKALKREPGAAAMSPYGDFDTVMSTLNAQLRAGPFMLGADFCAADVLWGSALALDDTVRAGSEDAGDQPAISSARPPALPRSAFAPRTRSWLHSRNRPDIGTEFPSSDWTDESSAHLEGKGRSISARTVAHGST